MKLVKINQKRAFELVAEQLEELILSGQLRPGDKFPPERAIILDLGISIRTLREAMRILEQKGLVEIKTGTKGGVFVKDATTEKLNESLGVLIRLNKYSVRELSELRLDLEGSSPRKRLAAPRKPILPGCGRWSTGSGKPWPIPRPHFTIIGNWTGSFTCPSPWPPKTDVSFHRPGHT